jgi:hypothetical protein
MKEYKLIQEYPGSPKIGTIATTKVHLSNALIDRPAGTASYQTQYTER